MLSIHGFFRLIPLLFHPPISLFAKFRKSEFETVFDKRYELPSFELILMYCTEL